MNTSTAEILNKGMTALIERLGEIDAEQFITIIMRERFDYTKWHSQHFDNFTLDEYMDQAVNFEKKHPFRGNAQRIRRDSIQ